MKGVVLKIGAVQSARMWCTSNKPKLTFTIIFLDEGFVGPLLFFFNLMEYTLYITVPLKSLNVRIAFR